MWPGFLERRWVTCCSYPIETCSGPKFLEKECFFIFFFPLGEGDLFGMSRIILALIST